MCVCVYYVCMYTYVRMYEYIHICVCVKSYSHLMKISRYYTHTHSSEVLQQICNFRENLTRSVKSVFKEIGKNLHF